MIKQTIKDHIPEIRPFTIVYSFLLVVGCLTIISKPTTLTQGGVQRKVQVVPQGLLAITDEKLVQEHPPVVVPMLPPTLPPRTAMEIPTTKLQTPCFAQKSAQEAKELFDIPDFASCTEVHSCLIQEKLPNGWEIAQNTNCPIPDRWLSGYMEKQRQQQDDDVFVAMYFGCNKGYDAIHTAAVISGRNDVFNKTTWREALQIEHLGVCGQGQDLDSPATSTHFKPTNIHCIEAMPSTVDRLQQAANKTTAIQHGFLVHNYAVSGTPGGKPILFPNVQPGYESLTMDSCDTESMREQCKEVPTITIDEYVARHVDTANKNNNTSTSTHPTSIFSTSSKRIPFISIDIEGFDYTAMQAATRTLFRTDYLEFEYHQVGDWGKQNLKHAIDFLDSIGFVCYWSGKKSVVAHHSLLDGLF